MNKMSYYELLGKIKEGTQPTTVIYNDMKFKWDNDSKNYELFLNEFDKATLESIDELPTTLKEALSEDKMTEENIIPADESDMISYYDLLTMGSKGKHPARIDYGEIQFFWNGEDYEFEGGAYLYEDKEQFLSGHMYEQSCFFNKSIIILED